MKIIITEEQLKMLQESDKDFKTIKTFGDIINFFNTHYFTILKNTLDKYLDEERDNFF